MRPIKFIVLVPAAMLLSSYLHRAAMTVLVCLTVIFSRNHNVSDGATQVCFNYRTLVRCVVRQKLDTQLVTTLPLPEQLTIMYSTRSYSLWTTENRYCLLEDRCEMTIE
jgi:hypothetical protein